MSLWDKENVQKMERQLTEWDNIFSDISDKELNPKFIKNL